MKYSKVFQAWPAFAWRWNFPFLLSASGFCMSLLCVTVWRFFPADVSFYSKHGSSNFCKSSSGDNKTCLNFFHCFFYTAGSFYCPSNGLFITFILYSPAPVWPHYDYSTALEFPDNYELHCFNKSLGQNGSQPHLQSSQREPDPGSAGQMELQVNIYVWRRILRTHQMPCKYDADEVIADHLRGGASHTSFTIMWIIHLICQISELNVTHLRR